MVYMVYMHVWGEIHAAMCDDHKSSGLSKGRGEVAYRIMRWEKFSLWLKIVQLAEAQIL